MCIRSRVQRPFALSLAEGLRVGFQQPVKPRTVGVFRVRTSFPRKQKSKLRYLIQNTGFLICEVE